jgi:hypothetical protein
MREWWWIGKDLEWSGRGLHDVVSGIYLERLRQPTKIVRIAGVPVEIWTDDLLNTMKDLRFSQRWLWRMPCSGIWRRVALVWTDVSEECIASIFRIEKSSNEEPTWAGGWRWRLGTETDPVSEKSCFLFSRILDDWKPRNPIILSEECYCLLGCDAV